MLRYRSYVGLTVFLWGVGLAPAASAANRAPTRGYAVCDAREMVALADGSLAPNACRASGFSDPDREPGFVFIKSTDCPEGAVSLSGGSLSAAPSAIASDCQVQLGVRDAAGLEPEGDSGLSVTVSVRSYSARLVASAPRVNAMQEGQTLQIPITLKAVSGRTRTPVSIDGAQSLVSVTKDGVDVASSAAAKFSFTGDKKLTFSPDGDDSGRWEVVARSHSGAGHADAAIAFVVKDMNPPNYITVSRPRPGEELPVGAESYMVRGHCDAVGEPVTVQLGGATSTTTCRAGGVWSAKVALGAEGDKSMTAGYAEGAGATAAAAARSFRKGAAGGGEGGGGGGGAPAITFGSSSVDDGVEGNIFITWTAQNVPAPVYRYKVMLFNVDADAVDADLGNAANGSKSILAATVDPSASYVLIIENSMTEERIAQTSSFTLPLGTGGGGGGGASATPSITSASGINAGSGSYEISWSGANLSGKYLTLEQQDAMGNFMQVFMLGDATAGIAAVEHNILTDGRTLRLKVWNNNMYTSNDGIVSPSWQYTAPSGGGGGGGPVANPTLSMMFISETSAYISWNVQAQSGDFIQAWANNAPVSSAVALTAGDLGKSIPLNSGLQLANGTTVSFFYYRADYSLVGETVATWSFAAPGGGGASATPSITSASGINAGSGSYEISWSGANLSGKYLTLEQQDAMGNFMQVFMLGDATAGIAAVEHNILTDGRTLRLKVWNNNMYTSNDGIVSPSWQYTAPSGGGGGSSGPAITSVTGALSSSQNGYYEITYSTQNASGFGVALVEVATGTVLSLDPNATGSYSVPVSLLTNDGSYKLELYSGTSPQGIYSNPFTISWYYPPTGISAVNQPAAGDPAVEVNLTFDSFYPYVQAVVTNESSEPLGGATYIGNVSAGDQLSNVSLGVTSPGLVQGTRIYLVLYSNGVEIARSGSIYIE